MACSCGATNCSFMPAEKEHHRSPWWCEQYTQSKKDLILQIDFGEQLHVYIYRTNPWTFHPTLHLSLILALNAGAADNLSTKVALMDVLVVPPFGLLCVTVIHGLPRWPKFTWYMWRTTRGTSRLMLRIGTVLHRLNSGSLQHRPVCRLKGISCFFKSEMLRGYLWHNSIHSI